MLSSAHAKEKASKRKCLMKFAENIRHLSSQRIAFCGDGDEVHSNFMQLIHLRALDDPNLVVFVSKKTNKYTSPQIQNELLRIMALQSLQCISTLIQASKYFALLADEVTDSANNEQFVICLQWVNDNLEPNQDFIGLYHVQSLQAGVLVGCLKDCMLCLNTDT